MNPNSKIYVAGHTGLVGSAIIRKLKTEGYNRLIVRTRKELNLLDTDAVAKFFQIKTPEYVFCCAAKVGGIFANDSYRGEFIYENLTIQNNLIHQSHLSGVKKLLFLGSSCIYPKFAEQPIREEALLTGILENTNEPYAITKITGLKMCEAYRIQYGKNFICAMPTNLYGPNDNYDLENSHVLAALIRRFSDAVKQNVPSVTLWGDGSPKREFLHTDDLANALYFLMKNYDEPKFLNVGTGKDISIAELAKLVCKISGFQGQILWDSSKPNGTPRKLLNVDKMKKLGWNAKIPLKVGVQREFESFHSRS